MTPEKTKILVEKYPEIFQMITQPLPDDSRLPITLFNFEHADGWYNIIDMACSAIKCHLDNNQWHLDFQEKESKEHELALAGDFSKLEARIAKNPEWYDKNPEWVVAEKQRILTPIAERYRKPVEKLPPVVATQIKEKYGTLRFYIDGGDEYIYGVIAMAENMSARTCEVCGSPGKLRRGGWFRTLCDAHAEENGYNINDGDEILDNE